MVREHQSGLSRQKDTGVAPLHPARPFVRPKGRPQKGAPTATARLRRVPSAAQTFRGRAKTHFAQTFARLFPETSTALRRRQMGRVGRGYQSSEKGATL
jgi:hypothetical protein